MQRRSSCTTLFMLLLFVIGGRLATSEATTAASLQPIRIESFFITPGISSQLEWRVTDSSSEPIKYAVRDYQEQLVTSGDLKPAGDGSVQLRLSLPAGYYQVEFPGTGQQFGIVSLPPTPRTDRPAEFFCIDSAMSWLVAEDATRQGLIRVLRRSGISMSRERFSWAAVHASRGEWQWETSSRYEAIRKEYDSVGVPILEMCHDAPSWMGQVGKYPQNLIEAEDSWQQINHRWQATWGGLEIWNEPDIFFGANLPGDQYVALTKTVAFAASQLEVSIPLVGGVVAHNNARFLNNVAENGLLRDLDAFSFHTYGRAPGMEKLVDQYRAWLISHKCGALPLWLTECGRPWPRGTDRASAAPDQASALDISMKAIEARCCGVARYFAFVYPFYEERDNNFGMMGRHGTPLRSMAAYAYLTSTLADKSYLGDLRCGDASIERARVFADEHETVAVIYRGKAEPAASVNLELPVLQATGLDGRRLASTAKGEVPCPDGLVYVRLNREQLGDRLQTDTTAKRLWDAAQQPAPRREAPSPIVLRFAFDKQYTAAKSEGYQISGDAPQQWPFRVEVFNLSDQPAELVLRIAGEAGASSWQDQRVSIPGRAASTVTWQMKTSDLFTAGNRMAVKVVASVDGNREVARLVMDFERIQKSE
jgi:hypothetical protein